MKKAVIVADDSAIVTKVVEDALSKDVVVLKASNGREAIKHITDKQYEIVCLLLDLNMPDYDGFMVLNYFKNNNLFKRIPISIITGDDSKETIERAFTYEIIDMLNKPFKAEDVRKIVYKTIGNKIWC